MKLSREKLTVKRTLDDIEGAWEAKGSDARYVYIYNTYVYKRLYGLDNSEHLIYTNISKVLITTFKVLASQV